MPKPMEAVYIAFGARVRMIREAMGIDQATLAERVGLQRTSITNIEAGRQRVLLADVQKFADGFGVTTKHLLKGIWW